MKHNQPRNKFGRFIKAQPRDTFGHFSNNNIISIKFECKFKHNVYTHKMFLLSDGPIWKFHAEGMHYTLTRMNKNYTLTRKDFAGNVENVKMTLISENY